MRNAILCKLGENYSFCQSFSGLVGSDVVIMSKGHVMFERVQVKCLEICSTAFCLFCFATSATVSSFSVPSFIITIFLAITISVSFHCSMCPLSGQFSCYLSFPPSFSLNLLICTVTSDTPKLEHPDLGSINLTMDSGGIIATNMSFCPYVTNMLSR